VEILAEPKVAYTDMPVGLDEDVARLEVSVDDLVTVKKLDRNDLAPVRRSILNHKLGESRDTHKLRDIEPSHVCFECLELVEEVGKITSRVIVLNEFSSGYVVERNCRQTVIK
jgi:hypothetical protein